jgi:hypothetical protein
MKENIYDRRSLNRPRLATITPTLRYSDFSRPYALSKGVGFWDLTFAGERAVFKHEQGAFYVAYLLLHPSAEPLHGLALALEIKALCGQTEGTCEIADPTSGRLVRVANNATLQQRSLGLDTAEAARNLHRKQQELEALLEDEDQIEPVKAEAQRELEAIYAFQKQHATRIRTSAEKAADAVGKAIKRLYHHLNSSVDEQGRPHRVLRAFAEHLKRYLLLPSGRCGGAGGLRAAENFGGCFVYQAPDGVEWRGALERWER